MVLHHSNGNPPEDNLLNLLAYFHHIFFFAQHKYTRLYFEKHILPTVYTKTYQLALNLEKIPCYDF